MKNEMKDKQNSGKQSVPWPDKNVKKQQGNNENKNGSSQEKIPWPEIKNKQKDPQTGNNMSIGNDPATANNSGNSSGNDPEINSPIYDPQKTEKKIPVMKNSEKPE